MWSRAREEEKDVGRAKAAGRARVAVERGGMVCAHTTDVMNMWCMRSDRLVDMIFLDCVCHDRTRRRRWGRKPRISS